MASCIGAALVLLGVIAQQSHAGPHPEARAVEHTSHVMPAARYASYPRAMETYEMAAAMPAVLDGVYCYCYCSQHSGHYSLLDCFGSDHAASCDICMSEAEIAFEMTQGGASLGQVRSEIDRTYGA